MLLCLFLVIQTILCDLPPGTRTRANSYLPPDQSKNGYDYNKPSGPGFPSGPGPAPPRPPPSFPQGPPARPPPSFPSGPPARPPAPRPPAPPLPSPGGGYPAPGARPSPGFPDYSGSPSGPSGSVSDELKLNLFVVVEIHN